MRKSSIYMLVAAIVLGLVAVFLARSFLNRSDQPVAQSQAVQTVNVVVAADAIEFGEEISAEKLKVAPFPAATLPSGTYSRVTDLTDGDRPRVALRPLAANELLTTTSVSGEGGRLSTSPLFGESMRAVSVPVNEIVGAGGFLVPGDRVDVFVTRQGDQDELPYTDLLVQGARVLASGQNADAAAAKPFVVKSVTIEVSPLQAQKLALAQQVGTLSLALRSLTDESRVRLETAQLLDLNDGTRTRILRKVKADAGGEAGAPAKPRGPTVEIFRGGKDGASSTVYGVPSR
ncbi:MAG: Flp pilus assembly protein CpaB [Polymorphobacter sp.]|uniref:Flp pilus assembly protein CpaB n=1 Tax=Polymorphobacter sp. TaxID=1909290 RepID=UPI003A8BF724